MAEASKKKKGEKFMPIIFDSQQQKETLFGILQMVQINAPISVARQQIIQVDDMLQAIVAGDVKPPASPAEAKGEDES